MEEGENDHPIGPFKTILINDLMMIREKAPDDLTA